MCCRIAALALTWMFAVAGSTLPATLATPTVALEQLRVQRVAADEASIALVLAIENTNAYDIAVDALDFSLAIAGSQVASGALTGPLSVPASGSARASIAAKTSFTALRTALDASLSKGAIDYELTGTVVVAGWKLPFARRGQKSVADLLGGR